LERNQSVEIKFSDVLYHEGYRELVMYTFSTALYDDGNTAIVIGYNTVPLRNPRAQLILLGSDGRVTLRRRYDADDLAMLGVKLASNGGLVAVYVPLRHLVAYSVDGARLWLYEVLSNAILSWSLSDDGRLAAVVEGQLLPTPASSVRDIISHPRKSAIYALYKLTLLENGSTVWSKTLELPSPTSSSVSVAVSPKGNYIAMMWPAKGSSTRLGVFSTGGDSLWNIDLDRTKGSDYIYDLGVSDDGKVMVCYGSRIISAESGRVLWVKHFPDKHFSCRVSRSSSVVLVGGGGKTYMIDDEGKILWAVDYDADRFDVSDNNYAVLASGNVVTVISPKGEVIRREELKERARYVKISPKGRYFIVLTGNYIHIFKNIPWI